MLTWFAYTAVPVLVSLTRAIRSEATIFGDGANVLVVPMYSRLLEGHVTWASGALILAFAAFIPALINPQSYAANELPLIVSRIQTIGLVGALASLFIAMKTLPPRPARYKRHRSLFMLLQWLYMPLTTIAYGSFAALYSQTRLMFRWYLTKFDVTDKAVKK